MQDNEFQVMAKPPQQVDRNQYRFAYSVKDRQSGDDFSHHQQQENGAVQGSYKVQLPDGRTQTVRYTADDINGYRAEVSYEDHQSLSTQLKSQPHRHGTTTYDSTSQYNYIKAPLNQHRLRPIVVTTPTAYD